MRYFHAIVWVIFGGIISTLSGYVYAADAPDFSSFKLTYLNTIPTARMDEVGTIEGGLSTLDPYAHSFIGLQIAKPLHIKIRQTALVSSLDDDADRLFPGLDFRLRLLQEGQYHPAIVLGMDSAIGHKRTASEMLTLSKHIDRFDLTGGLAWGRRGSAGHITNPLKGLSSHFGKSRAYDGELPNEIDDWFTGEKVGFFTGLAYDTKWNDVFLTADWGADRYVAETTAFDFNKTNPWSLGFIHFPRPWISWGAALVGGDKFLGQLRLKNKIDNWPKPKNKDQDPEPVRPYRTDMALPREIKLSAAQENVTLYNTGRHKQTVVTAMELHEGKSGPHQIGRAIRHMANHSGRDVEALAIIPTMYGINGPVVTLMRQDIEKALVHYEGSPQEIWHNADVQDKPDKDIEHLVSKEGALLATMDPQYSLILDNHLSLTEEDSGLLYRTSLVANINKGISRYFMSGFGLRVNIGNNLSRLGNTRGRAFLPVRSDVDRFASRTVGLDRLYLAWKKTLTPGLHIAATSGYLEEMYNGFGGEFLYRPLKKTYALGIETYAAAKRDPFSAFNTGLTGDQVLTGHINGWYEFPESNLTLKASVGQYLNTDVGITVMLSRDFENGAKVDAFLTATDQADADIFGGLTHLYSGMRFSFPLDVPEFLPANTSVAFDLSQIGRDTGQKLDAPLSLYAITTPMSYRHLSQHWGDVIE